MGMWKLEIIARLEEYVKRFLNDILDSGFTGLLVWYILVA